MSNVVSVAVMALTLPLWSMLVAQSTDNKPAPVKPLPPNSKPILPDAKPAPPKPAPSTDDEAAKRRERMQQRDREIDRLLKQKAKR